jgi:hypothetical protein
MCAQYSKQAVLSYVTASSIRIVHILLPPALCEAALQWLCCDPVHMPPECMQCRLCHCGCHTRAVEQVAVGLQDRACARLHSVVACSAVPAWPDQRAAAAWNPSQQVQGLTGRHMYRWIRMTLLLAGNCRLQQLISSSCPQPDLHGRRVLYEGALPQQLHPEHSQWVLVRE